MKKTAAVCVLCLAILGVVLLAGANRVSADSGFFISKGCVNCHGGTDTCTGCHAMGVHYNPTPANSQKLNLMASPSKNVYLPGEMVPVYISGGYHDGWCRIVLYDENMQELGRSASTRYMAGAVAPCCGPSFGYSGGVTLSSPAPLTEGTYTWNAAWYGNRFDVADSPSSGQLTSYYGPRWTPDLNNPNHGYEIISAEKFIVSSVPIPIASLLITSLNFGSVTAGGSLTKTAYVKNTGNGDLHVTSIAPCIGMSGEYSATPATPFTVITNATNQKTGTMQNLSVTYRPVDGGTDAGQLCISTDDSNNPVLKLNVTGSGYVPVSFDLDVAGFSVTPSVSLKSRKSIAIQLSVLNPGAASGSAIATVAGTLNGVQIYSQSLSVSDAIGDSRPTAFTFPSYKPTAVGTITWTATIADSNSDVDNATATTTVSR
jgi:hypothetical protein